MIAARKSNDTRLLLLRVEVMEGVVPSTKFEGPHSLHVFALNVNLDFDFTILI